MRNWRKNWRKTSLIAVGALTAGALLSYDVRATAQRVAQAPPTQAQSQLGQPTGLELPSSIGLPSLASPRSQQRNNRNNRNDRNNRNNRLNRDERRVPIPDVPFPGEGGRRRNTTQQRTLQRTPLYETPESGVTGQVVIQPICSVAASSSTCIARPFRGSVKVMPASRDRTYRVGTDEQGIFQMRLEPGVYIIQPDSPDFPAGTSQTVNVISSMMRTMRFDFPGYVQSQTVRTPGQIRQDTDRVIQGSGQSIQLSGQVFEASGQATAPQGQAPTAPRLLPNGFLQFFN